MSSISKAGIFIDVKQLLEFTYRMNNEMSVADRRNYGDAINSYLGMIKATSDLKWARAVLDAVQRPGFAKDYDNYKISIL